jgi:hypothetical protein
MVVKQQKINNKKPVIKEVSIVNEKVDRMVSDSSERIRVAVYVETAGMDNARLIHYVKKINEVYKDAVGTHYIVPVRNGKLSTEIQFEQEFLQTIRQICVVDSDGQINFRENFGDVIVIREHV